MILVGIDVASNKHDIFIMNALGEVFNKHFTIDNTRQGYKKLLSEISLAKEFFKDSNVRIGPQINWTLLQKYLTLLNPRGI